MVQFYKRRSVKAKEKELRLVLKCDKNYFIIKSSYD